MSLDEHCGDWNTPSTTAAASLSVRAATTTGAATAITATATAVTATTGLGGIKAVGVGALVSPISKAIVPFALRQPELDEGMRCALLEWLADVSLEYKMQISTYFLAVKLLDRVLMQLPIRKTKFQLLGCACLMIAGKLEEMEVGVGKVFFTTNSAFLFLISTLI